MLETDPISRSPEDMHVTIVRQLADVGDRVPHCLGVIAFSKQVMCGSGLQ